MGRTLPTRHLSLPLSKEVLALVLLVRRRVGELVQVSTGSTTVNPFCGVTGIRRRRLWMNSCRETSAVGAPGSTGEETGQRIGGGYSW